MLRAGAGRPELASESRRWTCWSGQP